MGFAAPPHSMLLSMTLPCFSQGCLALLPSAVIGGDVNLACGTHCSLAYLESRRAALFLTFFHHFYHLSQKKTFISVENSADAQRWLRDSLSIRGLESEMSEVLKKQRLGDNP